MLKGIKVLWKKKKIIHIREMLITAAAHFVCWADYPEDDIPQLQPEVLKIIYIRQMSKLNSSSLNLMQEKQLEGVNTVIAGRPNRENLH